jgi:hypothetical protein
VNFHRNQRYEYDVCELEYATVGPVSPAPFEQKSCKRTAPAWWPHFFFFFLQYTESLTSSLLVPVFGQLSTAGRLTVVLTEKRFAYRLKSCIHFCLLAAREWDIKKAESMFRDVSILHTFIFTLFNNHCAMWSSLSFDDLAP